MCCSSASFTSSFCCGLFPGEVCIFFAVFTFSVSTVYITLVTLNEFLYCRNPVTKLHNVLPIRFARYVLRDYVQWHFVPLKAVFLYRTQEVVGGMVVLQGEGECG